MNGTDTETSIKFSDPKILTSIPGIIPQKIQDLTETIPGIVPQKVQDLNRIIPRQKISLGFGS